MKTSYEYLIFPVGIREKLLKWINTSRIKVEFIEGKLIIINKTNIGLEEPNRIIFSNNEKTIEVLLYEDSNCFYLKDSSNPISFKSLVSLVNKSL